MKLATTLLIAGALLAGPTLAYAQGAADSAPGQKMQDKGSVKGTTGASGYAPGQTSGSKTNSDDTTRTKPK